MVDFKNTSKLKALIKTHRRFLHYNYVCRVTVCCFKRHQPRKCACPVKITFFSSFFTFVSFFSFFPEQVSLASDCFFVCFFSSFETCSQWAQFNLTITPTDQAVNICSTGITFFPYNYMNRNLWKHFRCSYEGFQQGGWIWESPALLHKLRVMCLLSKLIKWTWSW